MQTEYDFTLPRGYVDESGKTHKEGTMRLAIAADEVNTLRDPRVLANPAYQTIIILSRVITRLEGVDLISTSIIERLSTADFAFLQNMYQKINGIEPPTIVVTCASCGNKQEVPITFT